ncbi:hypothetical protein [Mesoplasma lactucae]|uniref:Uncharacterized protein n=1 Tax=Mesoplasma lactucae ATCC 49193 TaxID=81460 RepID=A0A291IRA4_9MOLU|nr:hypothetical protein [Mesoplasma lactucae]ATG97221.1 hypothetical protein CP520_00380 [Mesoplasma lactucae ATCC 49193]ATZ20337.1 hypothetical protein MLACT_v1c05160 [Mesoplasma lactucae ATCC 49193]MCL8216508.1 hypothetical protein [Mesoplasma lactucae ATCC 49193]
MRKLTRQLVLLVAVFIIYFGYSAWIDSMALYKLAGVYVEGMGLLNAANPHGTLLTEILNGLSLNADVTAGMGANAKNIALGMTINNGSAWLLNHQSGLNISVDATGGPYTVTGFQFTGLMASDSLLYSILTPFKLVLVGGVFGLLVPLTKQVFFGTVMGIKDYIKARRNNVLFNYQKTISYVYSLNSYLQLGDYEQIKSAYAGYSGLAFKPQFLDTMMDDIANSLIREQDMSIYIKPSDVVLNSIKQMYEKERRLAISMKPDEMFFDFKRGYEYTSNGSKYVIAYYKALDTNANSKSKLGWKLFSLEMYKFPIAMILAIIPMIIVAVIVLPILSKGTSSAGKAAPAVIFGVWMLFGILFHALSVFTKAQYRVNWKSLVVPAICYYVALALAASSFVVGLNAVINLGSIVAPNTSATKMWPWFSAVANMVLTTALMLYVVATLMDGNVSPMGMTSKLAVDGIVLPIIAWALGICFNMYGSFYDHGSEANTWNSVAFGITVGFWIYLSISNVLLNNLVLPSRKRRIALKAELAQEGQDAIAKQEAAGQMPTPTAKTTAKKSDKESKSK